MALTYGFYNSQDGDRKYDAVQMSSIFDGIIEDGIFQSIGTAMAVTASTGKTVVVGVGRAWFDHTWTLNDSGYPIELPESEVLLDRIDAVVLEVDASVAVRANSFKVVEGSPASSPQRPSLIDNETTHQHALAYILRRAGTEEVTQADITNVIGTSETPYVTGPLSIITADAMLAQWQSEFDQWFESLEDTLSGDVAANLANQIMQKVDKTSVIDDLDEIAATTEEGYVAGALAVKDLNSKKAIYEKANLSNPDQIAYRIGNTFVLQGTQIFPNVSGEYFRAWRRSELIESFKTAFPYLADKVSLDNTSYFNFAVAVTNGDAGAQTTHFYCPEYWAGSYDAWYVYAYPNLSGRLRINYEIKFYFEVD